MVKDYTAIVGASTRLCHQNRQALIHYALFNKNETVKHWVYDSCSEVTRLTTLADGMQIGRKTRAGISLTSLNWFDARSHRTCRT